MAEMPTTYAPPADIELPRSRALTAGLIGLVACAVGFFVDRDHFFRSWLIASPCCEKRIKPTTVPPGKPRDSMHKR
ncbi:MAG: hypothetical protein HYY76_00850 [Acidobacteria bacterium]|nr:hypothetical protein [Acidobacteriota bacterium]